MSKQQQQGELNRGRIVSQQFLVMAMVVGFEIEPFNTFTVCQRAWKIYGGEI
jgi:hypothetical protein